MKTLSTLLLCFFLFGDSGFSFQLFGAADPVGVAVCNETPPPLIEITPDSLCVTLPAGTSLTENITIANSGDEELTWQIGDSISVLIVSKYSFPFYDRPELTDALLESGNEVTINVLQQLIATPDVTALMNYDVIIISPGEPYTASEIAALRILLADYLAAGGGVIFVGVNHDIYSDTNIFPFYINTGQSVTLAGLTSTADPDHPLLEGVALPFAVSSYACGIIGNPDAQTTPLLGGVTGGEWFLIDRQVGTGRALFIASYFSVENPQTSRILANSLNYLNDATDDLVQTAPSAGTITAGSSTSVAVTIDATQLNAGTYYTDFPIYTNDPLAPEQNVTVKVIVTGEPELTVTPDPIDFSPTFVETSVTRSVDLNNTGTDTLLIDTVLLGNPGLYMIDTTRFTIVPGMSAPIAVTFVGPAPGNYDSTIEFVSNAGTLNVPLLAGVIEPPLLSVVPDSICDTLMVDQTSLHELTIVNSSGSAGIWQIEDGPEDAVEVLVWTTNAFNVYGIFQMLNELPLPVNTNEVDTFDPTVFTAALDEQDVLIMPFSEMSEDSLVYPAFAPVIQAYLANGGSVLFLRNNPDAPARTTGIFPGSTSNGYYDPIFDSEYPDHPLLRGIAFPYVGDFSGVGLDYPNDEEPENVKALLEANHGAIVLAETAFGAGRAVYFGYSYQEFPPGTIQIFENCIDYLSGRKPEWLTIPVFTDTIAAGQSVTQTLTLNSADLRTGTHNYSLVVNTNDPENAEIIVPVKLVVVAPVEARFEFSSPSVCNDPVRFRDVSLHQPFTWAWEFGDGATSSEQNPVHDYAGQGVYEVRLTVCNSVDCQTTSRNVIVPGTENCAQIVMGTTGSELTAACAGRVMDNGGATGKYENNSDYIVTIEAPAGSQVTLTVAAFELDDTDWLRIYDGSDTTVPIIGTYEFAQLVPGTTITSTGNTITLRFRTDDDERFGEFIIDWHCSAPLPVAVFSEATSAVCPNEVQFANESLYAMSYTWDFGDGTTSTEENPLHYFNAIGTYPVSLTVENEDGLDTHSRDVIIDSIPFELSIEASVDTTIIENDIDFFAVHEGEALAAYQWDFGNGTTSTSSSPTIAYSPSGVYLVTLVGTDQNSCRMYSQKYIHVFDYVDAADDPVERIQYRFFPNPVTDQLTLEITLPRPTDRYDFALHNALGQQVVYAAGRVGERQAFHIGKLPAGVYRASVMYEGRTVVIEKIVKK